MRERRYIETILTIRRITFVVPDRIERVESDSGKRKFKDKMHWKTSQDECKVSWWKDEYSKFNGLNYLSKVRRMNVYAASVS